MEAAVQIEPAVRVRKRKTLSHNLNGQRLGRKGRDTRERILTATRALIEDPSEPFVSLSAVARGASMGMTSLYLYFSDLTALLLSVLEPVTAEAEASYFALLREPWPDEGLYDHCLAFMTGFHDFARRHARLLRLRDSLAGQGDKGMMGHRVDLSMKTINLLVMQMHHNADGPALGMATALYAGFERVVAISTDTTMPAQIDRPFEPRTAHLLEAEARLIEFGIREYRGKA